MKKLKIFLFSIIILFLSLSILSFLEHHPLKKEIKPAYRPAAFLALEKISYTRQEIQKRRLLEDYLEYYNQNNDYIGWLSFESDIISEPVMFSNDNEKYLRKDFYLNKDGKGTIFMDQDCTLDSKNITLYGHYVYYDENAKFSPLHLLKDEENYDENKIIYFKLKDEIRTYQVYAVYYYDWMNEAGYFYQTADFQTEEGFLRHVRRAKDRAMYDTDIEINNEDRILTLQTCVRNRDDLRLIVVAKQID